MPLGQEVPLAGQDADVAREQYVDTAPNSQESGIGEEIAVVPHLVRNPMRAEAFIQGIIDAAAAARAAEANKQ